MPDKIDELLAAEILAPPADFAQRIAALARTVRQVPAQTQSLKPWQWVSLSAGAGLGALALCEFVFFAFVAAGAQ
jgi:hypothetical protein